MLDANFIRENVDLVKRGVAAKNIDPKLVDKFMKLDNDWRLKVAAVDHLRSEQNNVTKDLKRGKSSDLIAKAQILKKQLTKLEKEMSDLEKKRFQTWSLLPNLPLEDVPVGKSDAENVVIKENGKIKEFGFVPKDYLALAESLNIIDVRRAAKVSGSRFGYFLGGAAFLELALIQFIVRLLSDEKQIAKIIKDNDLSLPAKPFIPVIPPVLINKDSMWGMGYLDRGSDEIYHLSKDDLYLVGTSEQSIGPMHQKETFNSEELPIRYISFSPCFRREAGSYGKDTKGILRVHQFDKLEMFSFTSEDKSQEEHRLFLAIEEKIMKELGIPYRVLNICTGDLGDSAAAKFDIEAWLPGQNDGTGQYRETHSTSNTTDWQARRLNIKYKSIQDGKTEVKLAHLINGTAAAIGRMIIAILENYQTEKGTVKIPPALKEFIPIEEIAPPK